MYCSMFRIHICNVSCNDHIRCKTPATSTHISWRKFAGWGVAQCFAQMWMTETTFIIQGAERYNQCNMSVAHIHVHSTINWIAAGKSLENSNRWYELPVWLSIHYSQWLLEGHQPAPHLTPYTWSILWGQHRSHKVRTGSRQGQAMPWWSMAGQWLVNGGHWSFSSILMHAVGAIKTWSSKVCPAQVI